VFERIDYDVRQHAVYAAGRALSAETAQGWTEAFVKWAPGRRPLPVLDLGSGTGRFTALLAEAFGGPVYGVEPSQQMRRIAEETGWHPRVRYLAGAAEAIPLPDRACGLVLMFLVLHHVVNRPAAAAEILRVLQPGGRIVVRSAFSDRMPDLLWHQFFPRARQIEMQTFPSLADVVQLFTGAGMTIVGVDQVRETMAPSLAAYAARLRLRAISTFEYLTEEETRRGFAALDRAVEAERAPTPVVGDCDLVVFEAPPS
jgi:ubiquinone/menaquinone biosynthesis C-methylase UbiE